MDTPQQEVLAIASTSTSTKQPSLTQPHQEKQQQSENGIEVTLRNLSLSVIPPPSILTRVARKLKLAANPEKDQQQQQPTQHVNSNPTALEDGDEGMPIDGLSPVHTVINTPGSAQRSDRDLRHVGINIFRDVDLTVKPGQGALCCHNHQFSVSTLQSISNRSTPLSSAPLSTLSCSFSLFLKTGRIV